MELFRTFLIWVELKLIGTVTQQLLSKMELVRELVTILFLWNGTQQVTFGTELAGSSPVLKLSIANPQEFFDWSNFYKAT